MAEENITNPFRRRHEGAEPEEERTPRREEVERRDGRTLLGEEKGRRIRDMGSTIIPDESVLEDVNPQVLNLTPLDLEDLALEIAGLDSHNTKVKGLKAEDLQDIEAIFFEAKIRGIESQSRRPGGRPDTAGDMEPEIFDNWSCCCCTPCCCCAAAEVDPFDAD